MCSNMSTNHLTSTTFTAAMPTVNQTTADMKDSCKDNDEVVYLVSEEVSVRNLLLLAVEQQHYILRDLDLNETFLEEPCIHSRLKGRMRLQETKHFRYWIHSNFAPVGSDLHWFGLNPKDTNSSDSYIDYLLTTIPNISATYKLVNSFRKIQDQWCQQTKI